jgi:hypothetical protein
VTNGRDIEEITERIKTAGKFCPLMWDILWKWECLKGRKYAYLNVATCPY